MGGGGGGWFHTGATHCPRFREETSSVADPTSPPHRTSPVLECYLLPRIGA